MLSPLRPHSQPQQLIVPAWPTVCLQVFLFSLQLGHYIIYSPIILVCLLWGFITFVCFFGGGVYAPAAAV